PTARPGWYMPLPPGLRRAAEKAVRRRRGGGTEGRVADRAARLLARAAERDVLEVGSDVGALRHLEARAEQHRRHEACAQVGIRIDLVPEERPQMARALRV